MSKPITAAAASHSSYHNRTKSHHPAYDTTITHSKSALLIYSCLRKDLDIIQEDMYVVFPN